MWEYKNLVKLCLAFIAIHSVEAWLVRAIACRDVPLDDILDLHFHVRVATSRSSRAIAERYITNRTSKDAAVFRCRIFVFTIETDIAVLVVRRTPNDRPYRCCSTWYSTVERIATNNHTVETHSVFLCALTLSRTVLYTYIVHIQYLPSKREW